MVALWCWVS